MDRLKENEEVIDWVDWKNKAGKSRRLMTNRVNGIHCEIQARLACLFTFCWSFVK